MNGRTVTQQVAVGELTFDIAHGAPDTYTSGNGVTNALLLHGFPQTNVSFGAVSRLLNEAGVTTYAPNQRGYSPGARPSRISDYTMDHLVDDVAAMSDQLGLDRIHLVGHDFGAIVGWNVAARFPDLLATFTAISVPHPSAFGAAIRDDPDQRERSQYMEFFRQPDAPENALLADDAAALRIGYADVVPQESVDDFLAVLTQPGAMTAALNWYRALPTEHQTLPPTQVPTAFIWGTDDIAVRRAGVEKCGEHVEASFRYVELPGVSHWVPDEAPDEVAATVLNLIFNGSETTTPTTRRRTFEQVKDSPRK